MTPCIHQSIFNSSGNTDVQTGSISTLKIEAISSSVTSTPIHQTEHRHILRDRNLDTHRREKVKYHRKPRLVDTVPYSVGHRNGRNFKILTFHSDNLTTWSEFQPQRKCDKSV